LEAKAIQFKVGFMTSRKIFVASMRAISISLALGLQAQVIQAQVTDLPPCPHQEGSEWKQCFGVRRIGTEIFTGEFRDNRPNGFGTIVFPKGARYVGEISNGAMHGKGTYVHPNGTTYVGEFKSGLREGAGTLAIPGGANYSGDFRNDKRNGQGVYTYANGATYTGSHSQDKRDGFGVWRHPMGKKYVGEFTEGERTGLGIAYDADGSIAQSGKWRNNELIQSIAPDEVKQLLKKSSS
jgi:hypothetical protein